MSSPAPPEFTILIDVARAAIENHLNLPTSQDIELPEALVKSRGVFVTLLESTGELRGCIGHILPIMPTLREELETCAVAAATRDPRFPPVQPEEMASLTVEVSLLEVPEPIATQDLLNPREFGVIVRCGPKVGLLLPDLDGVDTVDYQLSIAMRKGQIAPSEDYSLERFRVLKIR